MNNTQALAIFKIKEHPVRIIEQNDDPWFVAKDVCEYFGDKTYRRSIARLDSDERGVAPCSTPGGIQKIAVVSEPGLYRLLFIMQPQKKSSMTAEQFNERVQKINEFQRWVTHKVLPQIHKHGFYGLPGSPAGAMEKVTESMGRLIDNLSGIEKRLRAVEMMESWRELQPQPRRVPR